MVHEVKNGKAKRMSFSKIKEVIEMPDLIDIQKSSYEWFLKSGLMDVLRDASPIKDFSENLMLEFVDYKLEEKTKYTLEEAKTRSTTYASRLQVKVRLINRETGEIKEQEIFFGDLPLMTDNGTFLINGAERVIVSQLVRSPGVYYDRQRDKTGKFLYSSTVIPNRGTWLEYESDSSDMLWARVDRTRKVPMTTLVRALGIETDGQIIDLFEDDNMTNSLYKDLSKTSDEALLEIYKKLRPGEPLHVDAAKSLLFGLLFEDRRYDLARVGRYKYNLKLSIANRIKGEITQDKIINPETGEIIVEAMEVISEDQAFEIKNCGINIVYLDKDGKRVKVIGNNTVNISKYLGFEIDKNIIKEEVHFPVLKNLLQENECEDGNQEKITKLIEKNREKLVIKHVTMDDIIASINYFINFRFGLGFVDDIDHLGNRRVRCVGELLQNQFRVGIARLERVVKERMVTQDLDSATPQSMINIKPIVSSLREFFGSSQLSQFMDQINPLAELTHKRRISALGPGGLSRDRAGFEVRDVHHTHYGRLCPIETPEGPNIGLIGSLSTFAKINRYGFVETPYRKIDKATGVISDVIEYMTADTEDNYVVAQANEPLDSENRFVHKRVKARDQAEILEIDREKVDYMDVSPKQLVSVATAMIPFLENDDANRALMGANMQRQAVPLIRADSPIVGTGIEYKAAVDSGIVITAKEDGIVSYVDAQKIIIDTKKGKQEYRLIKYQKSNQGTCINQKPIVVKGEDIKKGDVIADGPSTQNGELAIGKNILIGFMTWEGYNYEDAILISEDLVKEDVLTSIHIEDYDCESRDTKLGPEEITREVPNIGDDALKDLDENGIIRIGAVVRPGDILVGKVTPKGETELTAEEKLLRAIFGDKAREVRDTSLRVPHGETGTIVDVKIFTRDTSDELAAGVNKIVRIYIAQKRKISVGDKMAGRHGNKGVISRILPREDMPYMPDGTPLQIVLNPLGVPSRMNVGQVLEVHLGYVAKMLGWKIATPVFDGAKQEEIADLFEQQGLNRSGKFTLYDGRSGEKFDREVTVGYMYMLKLYHLVDDKIHARSIGPYSLVTQQPLGGKAQFGGQRFGEMEVWALEAYGAAYTLQEMLTVKSDDIVGRLKTYEAIVKGEPIPKPGIPEAFRVLTKELQSLGLDLKMYRQDEELELKDSVETEVDSREIVLETNEDIEKLNKIVQSDFEGMTFEDEDGEEIEDTEIEELNDDNKDYDVKTETGIYDDSDNVN
ncbi:MAG: DNA-directed RNA polymerase subunit beta [Clostridia bacterium]|nr:DNA-directed RNA polymerase subunit beta [Clostridia bacterium]MDD4386209.1 DNA-directed RNA polymerase subunit beta [Clostridia bacterium]